MARRLKGRSPYEIMRQTAAGADPGEGPPAKQLRVSRRKLERFASPRSTGDWWHEPLEALREYRHVLYQAGTAPLRIETPRLIVGAAAAGVVLVVVCAFWLGRFTSGAEAGEVTAAADPARPTARDTLLALRETVVPPAPVNPRSDLPASRLEREALARGETLVEEAEEAPGGGDRLGLPDADPRVDGLNYLALVTTTPQEARRIQGFFAEYGVATFITKPNNGGLVRVIDVSRGFTRDEYRSGAEADHRSHRLALGRAWKRFNNGIGDDLSSMAYSKYQGD